MTAFSAQGGVRFASAKIGGDLDCDGGHFKSKDEMPALNANGAQIGGFVFLRKGFTASGEVRLRNASIGKNLECSGGHFESNNEALDACRIKIEGGVFLRDGMVAEGKLSFCYARVVCDFVLRAVKSLKEVDLSFASVGTLLNERNSWPGDKMLSINGFVFDQIDDKAAPNAETRLDWINRRRRTEFSSQPFEQLAAVFRRMGREEDAVAVMIAKNREHGRLLRRPIWEWNRFWDLNGVFEWFWYRGIGRIIGYGYRPWNAFLLSIIVIGVGWFAFERGYHSSLVTPIEREKAYVVARDGTPQLSKHGEPVVSEGYPKFNAFVYSVETFVPLLKLQVSQYWIPNANRGEHCLGMAWLPKEGSLLRWYTHTSTSPPVGFLRRSG